MALEQTLGYLILFLGMNWWDILHFPIFKSFILQIFFSPRVKSWIGMKICLPIQLFTFGGTPIILKALRAYLLAELIWLLSGDSEPNHYGLEKNIEDIKPRLKRLETFLSFEWNQDNTVLMKVLGQVVADVYFLSRCARSFMSKSINSEHSWHAAVSGAKSIIKSSIFGGDNNVMDAYFSRGKERFGVKLFLFNDKAKQIMRSLI